LPTFLKFSWAFFASFNPATPTRRLIAEIRCFQFNLFVKTVWKSNSKNQICIWCRGVLQFERFDDNVAPLEHFCRRFASFVWNGSSMSNFFQHELERAITQVNYNIFE
jgi:hypothetical protein